MIRVLDGDFIYMYAKAETRKIGKFSGIVESPGLQVNLKDAIRDRGLGSR